jgi:hypothetical protein
MRDVATSALHLALGLAIVALGALAFGLWLYP